MATAVAVPEGRPSVVLPLLAAEMEEERAQQFLGQHPGKEGQPTLSLMYQRRISISSVSTCGSVSERLDALSDAEQDSFEGLDASSYPMGLLPGQGQLRRIERSYDFRGLCKLDDL
uniref:Uncharacterized protein n=1 Tax=Alexandrium catenella TaxID=2925 RepID=A0A7S1WBK4_ALECA